MSHAQILATFPASTMITIKARGGPYSWKFSMGNNDASRWIEVLASDSATWMTMMHDLMHRDHQMRLEEMISSGDIAIEDACAGMKCALETVTGRRWWMVLNIMAVASEAWDNIGGELASRGVNPSNMTIGAWVDAVWHLARKLAANVGEEQYRTLIAEIEREPVGPLAEDDMDMSFSEFMAAASTMPQVDQR